MKDMKKNLQKYGMVAIIALLISSATILANDNQQQKNVIIEQQETENVQLQEEVTAMNEQVEQLQKEVTELKEYVIALEESRKSTLIITREAPVYEKTSSLSKRMGTFPIGSVVNITSTSEDGVWYECEQGYFKTFYGISVANAQDTNSFIVYTEPVASTQPSTTEDNKQVNDALTKITGKSNLTLKQIENMLAGSPMSGCGQAILAVEEKYNVNAFFTISVAKAETNLGRTGTGASKKNPYGLTQAGGGYRTFNSYSEAVETFGSTLSRLYIPNGRTTIETVNQIYCPGNSEWSVNVRTVMKQFIKLT